MIGLRRATLVAGLVFAGGQLAVAEDARVRVRGAILTLQGTSMMVKTAGGVGVMIEVPEAVPVAATKAFALADIKPGMVLGVTTLQRADGSMVAVEVHPISATAPQGQSPWDLQPNSTMNNGTVEATAGATNGQELTLNYKTGTAKIFLLPQTAMAQATPGTRADLKTGETVVVFGSKNEAGKITALRVQVSKDGVNPAQ